ncbi:hypothetical protein K458DRAFT_356181 [Lentithecium fluviatile CBS 122367]|uniref:Clr5 domain-containing protein n=1 Tax=Lentithecium fluviatile CBS 122367 TaxID=1168545 RepID=A0A6G1JHX2_9PLEO|nr:hypothetical protein K458DRAFT_356181 [Lentithecium fluviatile CBS 122367]
MKEDNSLAEVMEHMEVKHKFCPTSKQYKDKFKSWKWIKRLPGEVAQWMVEKANERQTEEGKETTFSFKGRQWTIEQAQDTALRTRKLIVAETPSDIEVETPRRLGDQTSPASHGPEVDAQGRQIRSFNVESPAVRRTFPLTWEGKNRADLVQALQAARDSRRRQEFERAETEFLEALEGHRHLLTPTHEETVKIAFEMANCFAEQDRMKDANTTLERVSEDFIERFGAGHKKTVQYGLDVADLLKSWGRQEDALAFLAHARDAFERAHDDSEYERKAARNKSRRRRPTSPATRLKTIRDDMSADPSSSRIDRGIGTARTFVATGEAGVEDLLKCIESVCARDRQAFAIQSLQARAERLKLYNKQNMVFQHIADYTSTKDLWNQTWSQFVWDKDKSRTLDFLEASLELASACLRGGCDSDWMFGRAQRQAEETFGFNDERTIWTLISIGLVHQSALGWFAATRWFEAAYSAALSAYQSDDGLVKSLEIAMEKKFFSYVSDEGKPYKAIFGVNGLTFRPRRLHLE